MSGPTPLYSSAELHAAFELRYGWTGWPSGGEFPSALNDDLVRHIDPLWQTDGLRLLESRISFDQVQLTVSATPQLTPIFVAARLKGRLQHALRQVGAPVDFSRKVALRSIGHNRRVQVEAYIRDQTTKEPLADERFREFTVENKGVDLSKPTPTNSGRYWYNLHLVLVAEGRHRFVHLEPLTTIRDTCLGVAARKEHEISVLSVMPDHVHMAMRGDLDQSPEQIALSYLNNLAYSLGQTKVWQSGYYAGTFSEYDMGAVRRCEAETSPASSSGGDDSLGG